LADPASYEQLIEDLQTRVRAQVGGLQSLAEALAGEAERLRRRGQADLIAALRARVREGVADILLAEDQASTHFVQLKKRKTTAYQLAGIIQSFLPDSDRRLQRNAELTTMEQSRTAPFRTVVVQIAPPGIPDGVSIVSVSRLAREGGATEAEIRTRLEAGGCRLIEPAILFEILDGLQQDVLQGSALLPLTCEQLGVYLASRAPKKDST
jgi:Holliday junction resolvase-like predicted endonuclease